MKPFLKTTKRILAVRRVYTFSLISIALLFSSIYAFKRKYSVPAEKALMHLFGLPTSLRQSLEKGRFIIHPRELNVKIAVPEVVIPEILRKSEAVCCKPHVYVDIGTNEGQVLFPIIESLDYVRTYGFEPDRNVCQSAQRRAKEKGLSRRTTIFCSAVSENSGKAAFVHADATTSSFLDASNSGSNTRDEVPIVRLSDVISEDVLLLKTDTQGHELKVLRGAQDMLQSKKITIIVVEMSYGLLRTQNTTEIEVLKFIYDHGYVCTFLAWHGIVSKLNDTVEYGIVPLPEFRTSLLTFEEFAKELGPNPSRDFGSSTWTDILCF